MIRSMTGYGKACFENKNKKITVEIRSLNSKQLDINFKLPVLYREKEIEIRNLVAGHLERGKIEISFFVDIKNAGNIPLINKPVVKEYFNQLIELNEELGLAEREDMLNIIFRLPESLRAEREELDDKEWEEIKTTVMKSLNEVILFREQEGKILQEDMGNRINSILSLMKKIDDFEPLRISRVKGRLHKNLKEFMNGEEIDKNRFEQEVIFYLEKLDITEEKVRLKNHCEYFINTVNEEQAIGKKLGFIAQEIGREINTIGSKANDAAIQKIVVGMKDELEKVKEQLMNVL